MVVVDGSSGRIGAVVTVDNVLAMDRRDGGGGGSAGYGVMEMVAVVELAAPKLVVPRLW